MTTRHKDNSNYNIKNVFHIVYFNIYIRDNKYNEYISSTNILNIKKDKQIVANLYNTKHIFLLPPTS